MGPLIHDTSMPALHLFNTKFIIGSDDLTVPVLLGICLRILYMCVIAFSIQFPLDDAVQVWAFSLGIAFLLSAVLYTLIFIHSMKGSIMDVEKRILADTFLKMTLPILIAEVVINATGTVLLWAVDTKGGWTPLAIMNACIWMHMFMLFGCGCLLTSSHTTSEGNPWLLEEVLESAEDHEKSVHRWENRCRSWCCLFRVVTCNLFGGGAMEAGDATYADVAKVMSQFFTGLDLVPSDLIAALCLVRAEQRAREAAAVQAIIRRALHPSLNSPSDFNTPLNDSNMPASWLWPDKNDSLRAKMKLYVNNFENSHVALDDEAKRLLASAAAFAPFMLAIYGKLLFTYMNLITGPCNLMCPEAVHTSSVVHFEEDDCCGFHKSAFQNQLHGSNHVIVFVSYTNEAHMVPYGIGVDHTNRSVVVTIRGTISAADLLIDAMVHPESLLLEAKRWGFEDIVTEANYAHRGMLLSASKVREDIEHRGILQQLFNSNYGSINDLPDCTNYALVVIGHSLGAGIASILSLMVKPRFPHLRVIAYSPPGCVFDYELAERSTEWIDSVFLGSDMIPHASWHSLTKLRGQMMEVLRRCKVSKATAIRSAVTNTHAEDMLYHPDQVPRTFARDQLARKIEILRSKASDDELHMIRMHPPGRLLHIMRVSSRKGSCCSNTDKYLPVWIADRKVLDVFNVGRNMGLEHFPNNVASVICSVSKEFDTYSDGDSLV